MMKPNGSRTGENNRERKANRRQAVPVKGLRLGVAPFKGYRGPATLERITNGFGFEEWTVVLTKPYSAAAQPYLDAEKAMAHLLELARMGLPAPTGSSEETAQEVMLEGLLRPSRIVLETALKFVTTHGLLTWQGAADHCCEHITLSVCPVPDTAEWNGNVEYVSWDPLPMYEAGEDGWATRLQEGYSRYSGLHSYRDSDLYEYANTVGWMIFEADRLRQAYDLWQALVDFRRTGDARRASARIKVEYDQERRQLFEKFGEVRNSRQRSLYWIGLAYHRLEILLNQHLRLGNIGTEFALRVDGDYFTSLSRMSSQELIKVQIGARMEPTSVLAAIWMHLASVIQREERVCPQCGESLDGMKADKVYCRDACRMKFNRAHPR